jgi:hypothetical protein
MQFDRDEEQTAVEEWKREQHSESHECHLEGAPVVTAHEASTGLAPRVGGA